MISFLPVLAIMAIIFLLSHTPGGNLPSTFDGFDKFFHTFAYTTLGLAALIALRKRFSKAQLSTALLVILFCVVYGISDELHQAFIPGRTPSLLDLMADMGGGIIAVLAWTVWHKQKKATFQINGKSL